ncbi:histidine kinase [Streptomonospora sp. S1-112]|uniref:histidine kinase n=1 Tax=Streptomonospora mangrovi TaxID=2883123 RepID=A0A9X3NT64_9ACTN|nr:sensor histidine kinase [Streptomonospora mangrovi]MDA0567903.1 histidine kinase [Streptomonospora mangrovi]
MVAGEVARRGGVRAVWRARGADVLLWAALTGAVAAELDGVRVRPLPEVAAMAVLLAAAVAIRRARPFTALGLALGAAVAHSAYLALTPADLFLVSYVLPGAALAFLAGRRSDRTTPVAGLVGGAAAVLLASHAVTWVRMGVLRETLTGLTDWFGGVAVLVGAVIAPWLLGRYWRRHTELRTAGWEIAHRMERARDVDAERARLRERARIAGEMHDSLGHDLALIAVRAAALEMAAGDEEGRGAAAELRLAAHDANLRLREIIGVLREDAEASGGGPAEDVSALVSRAAGAGLAVRLIREGPDSDPGTPAGRAVHRVVQEALTNAARHAPGARVTVRVVREEGATEVRVSDTGSPVPGSAAMAGNGSGLAGLRSLVTGLGGAFTAGPAREGAVGGGRGAAGPRAGASGAGRTDTVDTADTAGDTDMADTAGADAETGAGTGFVVAARIPDAADDADRAAPDDATETARRLRAVRRTARRRLATALAVPAGLAAGVVAVAFLLLWYVGVNSVLAPADYARLHVGQEQSAVEAALPRFDYEPGRLVDPPPAPPGASCRYYLVEWSNGLPPVYRLCFAEGVLADKDRIERTDGPPAAAPQG